MVHEYNMTATGCCIARRRRGDAWTRNGKDGSDKFRSLVRGAPSFAGC